VDYVEQHLSIPAKVGIGGIGVGLFQRRYHNFLIEEALGGGFDEGGFP
jgi:hypothetical protein